MFRKHAIFLVWCLKFNHFDLNKVFLQFLDNVILTFYQSKHSTKSKTQKMGSKLFKPKILRTVRTPCSHLRQLQFTPIISSWQGNNVQVVKVTVIENVASTDTLHRIVVEHGLKIKNYFNIKHTKSKPATTQFRPRPKSPSFWLPACCLPILEK